MDEMTIGLIVAGFLTGVPSARAARDAGQLRRTTMRAKPIVLVGVLVLIGVFWIWVVTGPMVGPAPG
jgi:hypothetical protein